MGEALRPIIIQASCQPTIYLSNWFVGECRSKRGELLLLQSSASEQSWIDQSKGKRWYNLENMEVVIEDSQIQRFVLIKVPGPTFQNAPLDEKEEESLNPWMLSSH